MAGYCTWCGARLDENARYCPSCGARTTQVVTVDGSPDAVDPLRGLDIVEGERLPVEDTQRMKITEMSDKVVVSSGKARRFTQDTAVPKRRAAILVPIALVVIVCALVAGYLLSTTKASDAPLAPPAASGGSANDAADSPESDAPSAEPAAIVNDTASTALSEDEAYTALTGYYDKLDGFRSRLLSCVDDYNGTFESSSMSDRQAAYEKAKALEDDVSSACDEMRGLVFAPNSAYETDRAILIELYGYMLGRISPLVDSWELDLTFDDPSAHTDEILAKLSEHYVNGANPNVERYDRLHAAARPQKR